MNKSHQPQSSAKEAIKAYLDKRSACDEQFAKAYAKENKNIDECFRYILSKAMKRGVSVCMTDEEVFGLAVHYFDEDNLQVPKHIGPARAGHGPVPAVELTEKEKAAARRSARKAYERQCLREEAERTEKRRKAAAEKRAEQRKQLAAAPSLFDFADYEA